MLAHSGGPDRLLRTHRRPWRVAPGPREENTMETDTVIRIAEVLASVLVLAALPAYLGWRTLGVFQMIKDPYWQEMENRALDVRWGRRSR